MPWSSRRSSADHPFSSHHLYSFLFIIAVWRQTQPKTKRTMAGSTEAVEALDRRLRTLKKKIEETDSILQRKKEGEVLEPNQLTKLGTRKTREEEMAELEKKRRELLVAGGADVCKSFGVCSNCGVKGHDATQCPRPKKSASTAISSRPASDQERHGHARLPANTAKAARGGRGVAGSSDHSTASGLMLVQALPRHPDGQKNPQHTVEQVRQSGKEDPSMPHVLCVAEKPSVAKAIAQVMSGGKQRIRTHPDGLAPMCRLHDFYYYFPPANCKCSVTVTSVLGHMHSLDFDGNNYGDPANLFGAAVKKVVESTTVEQGIEAHLIAAARKSRYLFLWLDCDREGENICYEVIKVCREAGLFLDDKFISRARFSALTESHIKAAWQRPDKPDAKQSLAVDARQEIDLKVGVSFTRLLTHQLLAGAKLRFAKCAPRLRLLSYGPCQTPTLYFCVQRHREILSFVPRKFYSLCAIVSVIINGERTRLELDWAPGRVWDEAEARKAHQRCLQGRGCGGGGGGRGGGGWVACVESMGVKICEMHAPLGLNTVGLLTSASNSLGFSPAHTMVIAERLYINGILSYPRTESTRYPEDDTNTHTHTRTHTHTHTHIHRHTHTRTRTHAHTQTHTRLHAHTHTQTHTHKRTHTSTHTHQHTHTHTHTSTCTRTHTHKHVKTTPTQAHTRINTRTNTPTCFY